MTDTFWIPLTLSGTKLSIFCSSSFKTISCLSTKQVQTNVVLTFKKANTKGFFGV